MQHAHRVDLVHPSRGYIDSGPDHADVLPDPMQMKREDLVAERTQLTRELGRVHTDLTVAKLHRQRQATELLGQQHQALQSRLATIKIALKAQADPRESEPLAQAIRELCDEELQRAIFRRSRHIHQGKS